ncbi:MAG TPA: helix-turn-helix transcriptional regulator [Actinopolymorphaceae bacterium]|jgi:AraC-like DNA-binding protein
MFIDAQAALTGSGSVGIDVADPPVVAGLGVGLHGVARLHDRYNLRDLWSLHLYSYTARLVVDGIVHTVGPGTLTLVPPAAVMEYRYLGPSEHLYAHLEAPGGYWSEGDAARGWSQVPLLQELGPALPGIRDLMTSAIGHSAGIPARTRADMWTVLLQLAELGRSDHTDDVAERYVAASMSFIENYLAEAITVPDVARAAGISHNHLTRLFRARTNSTVVAHIRARRVARATHLLRQSTMSISAVAASVGIADLQAFNKTCRAATGLSPRQIRAGEL